MEKLRAFIKDNKQMYQYYKENPWHFINAYSSVLVYFVLSLPIYAVCLILLFNPTVRGAEIASTVLITSLLFAAIIAVVSKLISVAEEKVSENEFDENE